jgi:hypothetical protein
MKDGDSVPNKCETLMLAHLVKQLAKRARIEISNRQ